MKKAIIIGVIIIGFGLIALIFINYKSDNEINNIEKLNSSYDEADETPNYTTDVTYTDDKIITIGENIVIPNENVTINNDIITINNEGTFTINGEGKARIIVDAKDKIVKLIFNNLKLTYDSYPVYIKNASKVVITLNKDSVNEISDSSIGNEEINGVLFSEDDLTINGEGKLIINANYEDGIVSKDNLKIMAGIYEINAKDDAIRGTDSVAIADGTFTINASGDAIKSTKENDATKGYVNIENGIFNIDVGDEAIDATTDIQIKNGQFDITTGEGSASYLTTEGSKGIKASNNIIIESGVINIDSKDDSIHSNNYILIENGTITISSGDDGIHADNMLLIKNGNININKSYEGIEASNIEINDGTIYVISSDDGINGAGGNDQSSLSARPGRGAFSSSTGTLKINGGYMYIDASGDGIDVNGSIAMTNGIVIVNGPTNNGNGALDYDSDFNVTGGTLIAAGSSGMLQTISNSSTINCLAINTSSTNEIISVQDTNGANIMTFKPAKIYQSVVIATSLLKSNKTYNVYLGGENTGTAKDGLYTSATKNGTLLGSVTINNIITTIGNGGFDNRPSRR